MVKGVYSSLQLYFPGDRKHQYHLVPRAMRATKLYKIHLLPSTIELMSGTLLSNPWVAPELDWMFSPTNSSLPRTEEAAETSSLSSLTLEKFKEQSAERLEKEAIP